MVDRELIRQMIRNEADMAYRRRVVTIFEWLDPRPGEWVLDAGCGRGFYLHFIQHATQARVVGLELELPYLRIARAALLSGSASAPCLVAGSLYDPPFQAAQFDKVILSEVLEHVEDDTEALRSIRRVVKPDGLLAITVPNANYPFWWDPLNRTLETCFHTHIQRGALAGIWANHVRLYTAEALRATVLAAGLEIVAERSFTHHAFPFIHNIVYGFGKPMLEAGLLPSAVAAAADRHSLSGDRGSVFNPVHIGLTLFEWFDRHNVMDEPPGRSTVNLCVLARNPADTRR